MTPAKANPPINVHLPQLQPAHGAPAEAPPPVISVRNLNFFYGKFQALKDNNVDIPGRSVTAFIGPSGCGKSTHLRCFNRIYELYPRHRAEGAILLRGENILSRSVDVLDLRRRVGMIFQKPSPLPLSIYENIAYGLRTHFRIGRRDLDERVEQALRQAALWDEVKDRLGKPGAALSGGQQQRLCIARTIATEPEVLLMDEPCSSLDPVATGKIEELIEQLKKTYTLVIVTHNMQQAARVSSLTAFMYLGRLVEVGPTEQMFRQPHHKETQDYITGRMG